MNLKHLAVSVAITGVIIAIAFLTFYEYISLNIGIMAVVLSVILGTLPLFVPNLVDHLVKPRIILQVENLEFVKKENRDVEGFQLKGLITNKGKKNCFNLEGSFKIEDLQHRPPKLLYVRFDRKNGKETIEAREESMRAIDYAWISDKDLIYRGMWKELRQKDCVAFIFPYDPVSIGVGSRSFWSEYLLKLKNNTEYQVTVEVKGEDAEKNTVIVSKTIKISPPL